MAQTNHRVVRIVARGPVGGNSKTGFCIPIRYILADGRSFDGWDFFSKKRDAVANLAKFPRENMSDTALIFENGAWSGCVLWSPFSTIEEVL